MRKILFAFFVFVLSVPLFSVTVQYDTISTSAELSTWEGDTDTDLVTADKVCIGVIDANINRTTTFTIAGATTDATHYRMLIAKSSNKFNGTEGSGYSITFNGVDQDFYIQENYFKLKYFEISGDGSFRGRDFRIKNCAYTEIAYCLVNDWNRWALYYEGTTAATYDHWVLNCAVRDNNYTGLFADNYTVHVYNCAFHNNSDNDPLYGQICCQNGFIEVINTIATNSNNSWYNHDFWKRVSFAGYFTSGCRNNASTDSTAPGGGFCVFNLDDDSIFVDYVEPGTNYHLKNTATNKNYIIDKGWYINEVYPPFTLDCDDSARVSMSGNNPDIFHWDMGIDETSIPANAATIRYVRKIGDAATKWVGCSPVYGTLDSAIKASADFDKIYVAGGRYNEAIACDQPNIFIYGGFNGTENNLSGRQLRQQYMFQDASLFTIIDASGLDTSCFLTRAGVILDGFHLRNGVALRGAGVRASQDNDWAHPLAYSTIRNCRFDSCRSNDLYGWGSAVHIDDESVRGVISVEFCYAELCSAYCGTFEVMSGSLCAGRFINCMAYNCNGFGFEISVKDWAYFDDTDATSPANKTPGDCRSAGDTGSQYSGAPKSCLTTYLPLPDNMQHEIVNCIALLCTGNHARASMPYDPSYQSWAKDQRFMKYCFAGASGIIWGDTATQTTGTGSGVFWSRMFENEEFLHQDSMANKRLYFADSAVGDWRPTGASPFAKGGAGGKYANYLGVLPPIQGVVTRVSPMWIKK